MNKNIKLIEHPLIQHKLGYLRDKNTESHQFRDLIGEISKLIAYEALKDLKTIDATVETPIATAKVKKIEIAPIIVSIMRAGNAMAESLMNLLPFASGGHIGIYRDKFIHNTVEYYFKLPEDAKGRPIILVDPLLATADTAIACLDRLKQYEVGEIIFLTILASNEGLKKVEHFHPDVKIYTTSIEPELDANGYLIPGLGDAGDRIYKTK